MYGRKRASSKARSKSAQPRKKAKTVTQKAVRWGPLYNPHSPAIKQDMRVKMKYSEFFTINPGIAGSTGVYVFSANGLYDPNITGTGTQPTGFDQLMAIYGEYVVLGSTIKVYCRNQEQSTSSPSLFGVFVERVSATSSSWVDYVNNGDGVYKHVCTNASGAEVNWITYNADMQKLMNKDVELDEYAWGSVSANPTEQRYFHIVVQALDNLSDLGNHHLFAEITYDVLLRDRNLTVAS